MHVPGGQGGGLVSGTRPEPGCNSKSVRSMRVMQGVPADSALRASNRQLQRLSRCYLERVLVFLAHR